MVIVSAALTTVLVSCGPTNESSVGTGMTTSTQPVVPPPTPTTTVRPTTTSVPTTTTTTRPDRTLRRGDRGQAIRDLQARLDSLRFWVGTADGVFGRLTQQAVFAFQKSQGLDVDGAVGPATRTALADPKPVGTSSESGITFEVDKSRQLLVLASDGTPVWIWNTSTGTQRPYTYGGESHLADTPPGHHRVYRQVDGWDSGPLGNLYRPKYFHTDGIAIHGYRSVPPQAASHGCVRVSIAAIDFIWANDLAPIGTAVWVYGTTPQ